ncbi:MAG TPA: hypothetical protein VK211_07410 [Kamptonema sp.]|nr:hypothetical protein [Kamptonema sp.]
MKVAICPGIHDSKLTDAFLGALSSTWGLGGHLEPTIITPVTVFPAQDYPAYSAIDILQFLWSQEQRGESLIFISFSAGVVGAIGAAWAWQGLGGEVTAFIALDGWGVPLGGNFPIHRLSHDDFTHWSSALLGGGGESFYADPSVEHLDLWRSPQTAKGWRVGKNAEGRETKSPTTAAAFLVNLLKYYGVKSID